MKTIYRNGLVNDVPYFLEESDEFGIQELDGERVTDRFAYQGDSIKYDLDIALVGLYDFFRDLIFEDVCQYYNELPSLPIWVQEAGQSSDMDISANEFAELMEKSKVPNLYKHLYLVDCQFLIGTVQNLLCAMETAFIDYYRLISSFSLTDHFKSLTDQNGTIMNISMHSTQASNAVETYFTKAYSILDLVCKICYELQYLRTEFNGYSKIKSADILWGTRKKLRINSTSGTVFENCELVSNIEAIRNEIVHNGTWELNPKIFIHFKNGEEIERFMLYPDMEQGHLATVKSRRHFFSSDKKINNVLPVIHMEFKQRLIATIDAIRSTYGNMQSEK